MATSSRSHKLMVRVQCIEAALPPLEKVVLAQTSHIHFAYTAGMAFLYFLYFYVSIPHAYFSKFMLTYVCLSFASGVTTL